jgi:hypothetical protein
MPRTTLHRASAFVCLATQMLAVLCFNWVVLCVEANGAVAVEPIAQHECCESAHEAGARSLTAAPCDCLDTSVVQPSIDSRASRAEDAAALAAVAGAVLPSLALGAHARVDAPPPNRAASTVLRALRSVVLIA